MESPAGRPKPVFSLTMPLILRSIRVKHVVADTTSVENDNALGASETGNSACMRSGGSGTFGVAIFGGFSGMRLAGVQRFLLVSSGVA